MEGNFEKYRINIKDSFQDLKDVQFQKERAQQMLRYSN